MWLKQILVLIVLTMALMGGVLLKQNQLHKPEEQVLAVDELPDFLFPDVSGNNQSIKQWPDRVLVINFWATWCPPCIDELPDFNQLQAQYLNSGVQFVGVALDEVKDVQKAVASFKITYPQFVAGDEGINLSKRLGNQTGAVPFTIIVDAQGRVVQRHAGLYEHSQLAVDIDKLIH